VARGGSGLRTAIKIAKAIDRAQKQSAREASRQHKKREREQAKRQREHNQRIRQQEREQIAEEKAILAAEKKRFKQSLENAKYAFEERCIKRQELRNKIVDQELS